MSISVPRCQHVTTLTPILMFRSFGRQLGNKAMTMDTTYILYDIPGTATKHQSWSPDVWKTRYVTKRDTPWTEWVEFPDIAEVAKRIGEPHTVLQRGGKPLYTVPILRDLATDRCLLGHFRSPSI
jgi:hypothetical protein